MANPENNHNLPTPENPSDGFSIEVKNPDKIYNLLKNKQFQQGWEVLDDKNHCADVLGEIIPGDNLFKVVHVEVRGLDGGVSYYQDYNLHLSLYRQVGFGNDDRPNRPIDENKRYFTEDKVQELMKRLSLLGMSTSYKKHKGLRYLEIESNGQKYIFSCGPSSLEEVLLDNNNNKHRFKEYKSVEELLKTENIYLPWFAFYIENEGIDSRHLYDQYLQLTTQQKFEESLNGFVQTSERLINILYQIYDEHPFISKLVLDYPDYFYKGKGPCGTYRRHQISTLSIQKKENRQSEINSDAESFNKKSIIKNVTFNSIAGQSRAVAEAKKLVLAINHPEIYEKRGVKPIKGILLYGPTGTGKTLIAKAIAAEVNAELFEVSCADINTKWYGESEQRIQELFDNANKVASTGKKAVIIFDEMDALAMNREGSYEGSKKVVSVILQNLDGFRSKSGVIIVGMTNRPQDIDPAIKRPGRIDKIIEVGLPDLEDRKAILQLHINKAIERSTESHDLFSSELDLQKVAESTDGMSGADLANIINLTLETKSFSELEGLRWTPVTNADIERTLVDFKLKQEEKRKIGFN